MVWDAFLHLALHLREQVLHVCLRQALPSPAVNPLQAGPVRAPLDNWTEPEARQCDIAGDGQLRQQLCPTKVLVCRCYRKCRMLITAEGHGKGMVRLQMPPSPQATSHLPTQPA